LLSIFVAPFSESVSFHPKGMQFPAWPGQYLSQTFGTGYDIHDMSAIKMIDVMARTVARDPTALSFFPIRGGALANG
jgi:hypothetical protein